MDPNASELGLSTEKLVSLEKEPEPGFATDLCRSVSGYYKFNDEIPIGLESTIGKINELLEIPATEERESQLKSLIKTDGLLRETLLGLKDSEKPGLIIFLYNQDSMLTPEQLAVQELFTSLLSKKYNYDESISSVQRKSGALSQQRLFEQLIKNSSSENAAFIQKGSDCFEFLTDVFEENINQLSDKSENKLNSRDRVFADSVKGVLSMVVGSNIIKSMYESQYPDSKIEVAFSTPTFDVVNKIDMFISKDGQKVAAVQFKSNSNKINVPNDGQATTQLRVYPNDQESKWQAPFLSVPLIGRQVKDSKGENISFSAMVLNSSISRTQTGKVISTALGDVRCMMLDQDGNPTLGYFMGGYESSREVFESIHQVAEEYFSLVDRVGFEDITLRNGKFHLPQPDGSKVKHPALFSEMLKFVGGVREMVKKNSVPVINPVDLYFIEVYFGHLGGKDIVQLTREVSEWSKDVSSGLKYVTGPKAA